MVIGGHLRRRTLAHRAERSYLVTVPVAPHRSVFRSTRAFAHDTDRPPIDADHVAAEWSLMYHWLTRDEEMASACGFGPAELGDSARRARIAELRREVGPRGRTFAVLPHELQFWV